jgi:hypothetical protein
MGTLKSIRGMLKHELPRAVAYTVIAFLAFELLELKSQAASVAIAPVDAAQVALLLIDDGIAHPRECDLIAGVALDCLFMD